MRILITGGAGYVGCVLTETLLYGAHEVVIYDNLTYGGHGLLGQIDDENVSFVQGDVLDLERLYAASLGCDAVVHLAAVVGYPACNRNKRLSEMINLQGTLNVLDLGLPVIYGSTQSVYGKQEGTVDERTEPAPLTVYARTKLDAEKAVVTAGGIALRFPTLFGVSPRMRWDLIVNDFVHQAVTNHVLVVYQPNAFRPILHVRDAAQAYLHATMGQFAPGVHNIGNGNLVCTKADLAEAISSLVSCEVIYKDFDEDRDARNYRINFGSGLVHPSYYSLGEGIEALVKAVALTQERTWRNA